VLNLLLMEISFDEPKRIQNLEKHGLDFSDIDVAYFVGSVIVPAKLGRFMAIGVLSQDVIATVFAKLGTQGVSIVSMLRASRKERNAYEQYYSKIVQTN
jgi:uncharacterized protein